MDESSDLEQSNRLNKLEQYIKTGKITGFQIIEVSKNTFECKQCGEILNKNQSYNNKGCYCVECFKFWRKCNYLENKEKVKSQVKEYDKNNKDNLNNRLKRYHNTNKGIFWRREYHRKYINEKYNNNTLFRLSRLIRTRTRDFLKNRKLTKKYKMSEYLGCDLGELKMHLEKQFTEGMSWENQGKWHIDHIIPLSSAQTEEDMYKLCHYTNLQPLWARDNISKGAKY